VKVEQLVDMLQDTNKEWLIGQLERAEYQGKRVILSSDDLTGDESDEEVQDIISIRELVLG
jgi:hypothetical protein